MRPKDARQNGDEVVEQTSRSPVKREDPPWVVGNPAATDMVVTEHTLHEEQSTGNRGVSSAEGIGYSFVRICPGPLADINQCQYGHVGGASLR